MDEETDDDTLAGLRPSLGDLAGPLCLVVQSPGSTVSVPLPPRAALTLGRAIECDVRIPDTKLSRRHVEIRRGDEITVVDLGSRNGTLLRGERLPANVPVVLRPGDSLALGGSVVTLQRAETSIERAIHVWSHGHFEVVLAEECARATASTVFAVVRARIHVGGVALDDAAEPGAPPAPIVSWLRPSDLLALYAPNEYEVLLSGDAEERAAELVRSLEASRTPSSVAVAAYPRDGRTPERLIEHATRILRRDASAPAETAVFPSAALERMDKDVARVAAGTISVLVLGETGVGKELLSRRIHALSPRAIRPFVALNCAALSESLLESELFGHEKGAFTGALTAKVGLLEAADGGTVFLDEIGEMPLSVQAKLLRVIEQREVTRLGSLRPRAIDVRFVSATHRDPEAEVAAGRFRQDLYFRLGGVALLVPPLRKRVDEIEPLARAFVQRSCEALGRSRVPSITEAALQALKQYGWPGNVRELKNVIERAVLLSSGDFVDLQHLPVEKLCEARPVAAPARTAAAPGEGTRDTPPPPPPDAGEKQRIEAALEQCGGNQSEAAEALGMSRQTFIRRLEEYGIPRPRKRV